MNETPKMCACGNEIPDRLWIGNAPATVCWACQAKVRAAAKAARKAELAAMPRCDVPACKARGRYTVAGRTRLCGKHLKIAKANRMKAAGENAFLVFLNQGMLDHESLIKFANGGVE
jgi:hypothetical protein